MLQSRPPMPRPSPRRAAVPQPFQGLQGAAWSLSRFPDATENFQSDSAVCSQRALFPRLRRPGSPAREQRERGSYVLSGQVNASASLAMPCVILGLLVAFLGTRGRGEDCHTWQGLEAFEAIARKEEKISWRRLSTQTPPGY